MVTIGAALLAIARAGTCGDDGGGSLVHGVNFEMRSVLDESFCVETDVAVNPTPRVFVAPCTGRSSQRWTYTDGADGSSIILSELGHCLEVDNQSQPMTLQVVTCDYTTNQRFTVSNIGRLLRKFSNLCVTIDSPLVTGNGVFVEECRSASDRRQLWRFVQ